MLQIIEKWNLARLDEEMREHVGTIDFRGYNPETFLTGEFASKLTNKEIRPLSVSNIADKRCPTRRDLYFYKGINRLPRTERKDTWGTKAGHFIENYVLSVFNKVGGEDNENYSSLIAEGNSLYTTFIGEEKGHCEELKSLEEESSGVIEGDTDWLLKLLCNNGKSELAIKILHSLLKEEDSLDITNIKPKKGISPNVNEIGISDPATPDFIIPDFGIVGDIKTGIEFQSHFQLTCAGYALAYENENGEKSEIDWGIIYLFPSRVPAKRRFVRPVTFTQVYIFPINDFLRESFITLRDEAYNIVSNINPPDFPGEKKREHCKYCGFKEYCVSQGLELKENEQ